MSLCLVKGADDVRLAVMNPEVSPVESVRKLKTVSLSGFREHFLGFWFPDWERLRLCAVILSWCPLCVGGWAGGGEP